MNGKPVPSALANELHTLQQAYFKKLSLHIISLRRLQELVLQGFVPITDIQNLYRMTHNLAGSGGTFGFPELSASARDLHGCLKDYLHSNRTGFRDDGEKEQFLTKLRTLEEQCRIAMAKQTESPLPESNSSSSVETEGEDSSGKNVIILSTKEGRSTIAPQLVHFNYNSVLLEGADAFRHLQQSKAPDILIVYTDLGQRDYAELDAYCRKNSDLIVVIISSAESFQIRLSAVHLGVKGFFTEDTAFLKIIEKIEKISSAQKRQASFNILIVDDDEILAGFYKNMLGRVGINTTITSGAQDCLKILAAQPIDLILIDYDMPNCNGQELANIIRQHDQYVSLPLVFMSAKDDIESELIDAGLGIDEYLTKPFSIERMVSVVKSRARRSAELRDFMVRDSFTGLYNHKHFLEVLGNELSHVKRHDRKCTYATIDIDKFKSINDTYGHGMGDKVIKALSLTLQKYLRRSDIIGRCGGEEFGILMPDCNIEFAMDAMNKIRHRFSELTFEGETILAGITFSGGLIELSGDLSAEETISLADKALYKAKTGGRNQLVKAERD